MLEALLTLAVLLFVASLALHRWTKNHTHRPQHRAHHWPFHP